ncbi:hypothetical protein [Sciscionella marina]|uniref:hypothetical protein n=1 Tax=Sciscionella marina TaxID=508770 RepID=UPI0012F653F4|nr:hypothetical protein [Sciscionella marina]
MNVRTIERFLVHKTPSKHRFFALIDGTLEAVTTLGEQDFGLTEELHQAMNEVLSSGNDASLAAVTNKLPNAVSVGVRQYLPEGYLPELGHFGGRGAAISTIQRLYFNDSEVSRDEIFEMLEATYTLTLGVRAENQRLSNGKREWFLCLMHDSPISSSEDPRTWSLPSDVPVEQTWTSCLHTGNGLDEAWSIALDGNERDRWVRIHLSEHLESDDSGTWEWIVDVFDAIPPLSPLDDEE